jgi:SAM-dependent methyltransferase
VGRFNVSGVAREELKNDFAMISILKKCLPWWAKIGSKLVLRRLSKSQGFWRHFGLFQHGFMLEVDYVSGVFADHYAMARPYLPTGGFTLLEMGPGDSVATAMLARAYGAEKSYLMDVHAAASMNVADYNKMALELKERVPMPERMGTDHASVAAMLTATNSDYHTGGLADWAKVPSGSVDWVFSHAVLEHVRRAEFVDTLIEGARVLKPGGIATHCVDMGDHLGDSLHSLRFSEDIWESRLFQESGFYTNRLRSSELLEAFKKAGYEVVSTKLVQWPSMPLPRADLDEAFRGFSDEVLRTHSIYIAAKKV